MVEYIKYVPILLENEGCFSEHPYDRGGKTIFGISSKWFPREFDEIYFLYKDNRIDEAKSKAIEFYKREFWDKLYCDEYVSQNLANLVCDTGVNQGLYNAKEILKEVMNVHPKTKYRDIIQLCNESKEINNIINHYVDIRIRYYKLSTIKDPKQKVFLKGWLNRARKFKV